MGNLPLFVPVSAIAGQEPATLALESRTPFHFTLLNDFCEARATGLIMCTLLHP